MIVRRAANDSNSAVKRQVASAIEKLEHRESENKRERQSAKVLIKIGSVESADGKSRAEAIGAAAQASRKALLKIPGVALLNPTEDPTAASKRHNRPALLVQPSIRSLTSEKRGGELVASARIEFLVQRVPELSIMGKLSGNAKASSQDSTPAARAELEQAALDAAVDSALRESRQALMSASGS